MLSRRSLLGRFAGVVAGTVLARMPIAGAKRETHDPKIIGIESAGDFESLTTVRLLAGGTIKAGECVYQSGGRCYPAHLSNTRAKAVGIALESSQPGQFFPGILVATSGIVHFTHALPPRTSGIFSIKEIRAIRAMEKM